MSDTFVSMITKKPPGPAVGGFRVLSAAEAAEIADNAGCRTGVDLLFGVVATRIEMLSNGGLHEFQRPFEGHPEFGFDALVKPADKPTMIQVLLKLRECGYTVDGPEDDPEQAVIRW